MNPIGYPFRRKRKDVLLKGRVRKPLSFRWEPPLQFWHVGVIFLQFAPSWTFACALKPLLRNSFVPRDRIGTAGAPHGCFWEDLPHVQEGKDEAFWSDQAYQEHWPKGSTYLLWNQEGPQVSAVRVPDDQGMMAGEDRHQFWRTRRGI